MNEAPTQEMCDVIDVEFTPRETSGQVRLRQPLKRRMFLQIQRILRSSVLRLSLYWTGTVLGILWASPLTAVGLAIALPIVALRGHAQLVRGLTPALLVRGRFADFLLRRHPFGAMNAMAIGHVVIASSDGLSSRVLIHELAHVRQAARWGPLFPFAYLVSSAWAALHGKDAYWHNRFEVDARRAEKRF